MASIDLWKLSLCICCQAHPPQNPSLGVIFFLLYGPSKRDTDSHLSHATRVGELSNDLGIIVGVGVAYNLPRKGILKALCMKVGCFLFKISKNIFVLLFVSNSLCQRACCLRISAIHFWPGQLQNCVEDFNRIFRGLFWASFPASSQISI